MDQQVLKERVAQAVLSHLDGVEVLGVGSGSTVLCFIQALKESGRTFKAIVAASKESERALEAAGFQIADLNTLDGIDVYVDGADEADPNKNLIKGGGAALTREKILAAASKRFICIADGSKRVAKLGAFPLPVEVIPMSCNAVIRYLESLGGKAQRRGEVITDNGNWLVDVTGLDFAHPLEMEQTIGSLAGVVTVGIFARNRPQIVLMSEKDGSISKW